MSSIGDAGIVNDHRPHVRIRLRPDAALSALDISAPVERGDDGRNRRRSAAIASGNAGRAGARGGGGGNARSDAGSASDCIAATYSWRCAAGS